MKLVEIKDIPKRETYQMNLRKPSEMPMAEQNETKIPYIVAIKESCPMQYLTTCGITFEKYVLSPDASLSRNQGKQAIPSLLCRLFTEKQVAYLRDRLENLDVTYCQKNEKTEESVQVMDKAINVVIFKPVSQYNPHEDVVKFSEVQANVNREIPSKKKG